mmetsp:Transcript_8491/g.12501  ORF Transcript_8491/g.12501 Transcript_8491/m.12501 type:complete len:321 (-) Transcript_8491:74-1036(-)
MILKECGNMPFFNELRANTTQHPILLTAPFLSISVNAKAYRERVARILLEKFDAPAIDFVDHSVLALYANGSTTGCVVDSGYDITSIVPIYEGYVLQHATRSINLGGIDITKYLRRLLVECSSQSNQWIGDGNDSNKQNNLILCDIKHTLCYVALDYEEEMAKTSCALEDIQKPYVLPNMESVMIGAERFQCPEIMFQPDLIGLADEEGIADSVVSAIGICVDGGANNEQLQRELYANVTLAGGNTLFPGMEERMLIELKKNIPVSMNVNILSLPSEQRKYSSWIGGSIIASLVTFGANSWLLKEDYDECGSKIIHRKYP